jgi:alpha-tubulin suppressor-like RCC1 family protein
MSARTVRCSGARRPCAPAVPTLIAAALVGLLACGEDQSPTQPEFKPVAAPSFTVSPSVLQFNLPAAAPATLTVTSKTANTIGAASSNATCLVSPASAALTKPRAMGSYTGTFTVAPSTAATSPGGCTITFTDKKGGQSTVAVTFASQVRPRLATIATGNYHSCALDASGAAWCWGFNQYGSLGDGTTTDHSAPAPVTGGLTFTSLTAGATHTCGLTVAGAAYCWGRGSTIGDGALVDRPAPTAVAGGLTFVQLAASGSRTCGLTSAGNAYCWGRNSEGELGDGTFENRLVPTAVTTAGGLPVVFASLEAGAAHTCGLTGGGKAYCWGYNANGQAGDGTLNSVLTAPTAVAGGRLFTELTGRANSTCGLSGGALYCWGSNGTGQLGDGTTTTHAAPSPASGGPFAALGAGSTPDPDPAGTHACALTSSGAAYCWGWNASGQIGDGTTTDRSTPTVVTGPGGGAPLAFASISTGFAHNCGRTTGDAIYCWGANNSGQLGSDGVNQSTPALVSFGGPRITGLSLGSSTIAIESGTTYDVTLFNPGNTRSIVVLQGYVLQGATNRAAGGVNVNCSGTVDGILPPGSCTSSWTFTASNSGGGSGTLVPGPATFQLDLVEGTTILDSKTMSITLQ